MRSPLLLCGTALLLGTVTPALAQEPTPYDNINAAAARDPVKVHKLRGNVSMLEGSGGNITAFAATDGIFLVDAGIAVSEQKIRAALRTLGPGTLRYVVTTHWHWDHADGNSWVRRAGATLISSQNVAKRLGETIRVEEWGHTFTPIPPAARPNMVVPGAKTMKFGGETILIRPYADGHTDGDLSVYFQKADVLSTGDTFWTDMYPFIDYVAGGSIDGSIRAANRNIALAGARTLIVPGHGRVATRGDLVAFRDMLVAVRGKVAVLKAQGKSLEQAIAARPTAEHDNKWGKSIVDGALFTALVYRGV